MTPILVPTLAELGVELERAYSAEKAALAATTAAQSIGAEHPLEIAYRDAVDRTAEIIREISHLPASSPADYRVKARALQWYYETVEAAGPSPDEQLAFQIASGILRGDLECAR